MASLWTGTRGSQSRYFTLGTVGRLTFFAASDGSPGEMLWRTDGTEAGTIALGTFVALAPEDDNFSWLHRSAATGVGDTLFFAADEGVHGLELWKSDGSALGTVLVEDLSPGSASSYPRELTELNGSLFFTAYDQVHGMSLRRSDGVTTELVKAMGSESSSGYLEELTAMQGLMYFAGDDGTSGTALWKSDGTASGTSLVKAPLAGEYVSLWALTEMNGTLFFAASDGYGLVQLWKSNGGAADTVLVKDGFDYVELIYPVPSQGLLYLSASDSAHGYELWRSDGTQGGTYLLKDIQPGAGSSGAHAVTPVSTGVVFTAYAETQGSELWRTDGTQAGTVLLKDVWPGVRSGVRPVYPEDSIVEMLGMEDRGLALFTGVTETGGAELWRTDGTAAGTVRLVDLVAGAGSSEPGSFARMGDRLFFMAGDTARGREPRFLFFPKALGSALGAAVIQGNTCAALAQITPSCTANALAPDSSFSWTAPSAGTFTFTTEGSSYDTSLEVSNPGTEASLGCNDDTGDSLQSAVTVSLSAGQTVFITVDGYDTECGPFVLNILSAP
jgi:ELWxxDGT repeat protein